MTGVPGAEGTQAIAALLATPSLRLRLRLANRRARNVSAENRRGPPNRTSSTRGTIGSLEERQRTAAIGPPRASAKLALSSWSAALCEALRLHADVTTCRRRGIRYRSQDD
ncbi:hypothetical protein GGI07_005450 [Coemansia sp. Benny D115]|nr:hypothetical protein GGI07_005450 [Coemansia sp. Benny D115]